MLKALAILAFLLLGATIFVTIEDQRSAERAPQQTAQQPTSAVASGQGNQQSQGNTQKPSRNLPSLHRFFTWPDSMTAWAILLTLWAIAWQSNETKKAAEAAHMNAQAIVDAERAWMLPKITQPDYREILLLTDRGDDWNLPIEITFTNHGHTPAIAINASWKFYSESIVDPRSQTWVLVLPEPPYYDSEIVPFSPGAIYVHNDKTRFYLGIPRAFLTAEQNAWQLGQKCLSVRGFIEYRDIFQNRHITRFCYAFQKVSEIRRIERVLTGKPPIPYEFRKAGPDVYNEIT